MSSNYNLGPDTLLAQALHYLDPVNGGIVPGVQMATTYARDRDYELRAPGISYGRDKNPTYLLAEQVMAELEGAAGALLFSSGLAAAAALFHTLKPGDHVVAPVVMYHGLSRCFCRTVSHALPPKVALRSHGSTDVRL